LKTALDNILSWHVDGKPNLHTASLFKLTKRLFPSLTHCWFYCSVTQTTYDVTYDV